MARKRFVLLVPSFCAVCLLSCPSHPVSAQDDPQPEVKEPEKKAASKDAGARAAPATPAEQKIEDALALRKVHKYDEAFAALKAATALNPSSKVAADVIFRTGETYFRKGQDAAEGKISGVDSDSCFHEALKAFGELPQKYPKEEITPEGVYLLGSTHLVLGELDKALAAYTSAYKDFPAYAGRSKALVRVGVCQAGLDNPGAARQALQMSLKEFPNVPVVDSNKTRKYLFELGLIGQMAPPLPVSQWVDNVAVNGLKTFEGEVVVLVFFATWCENCRSELPHLRNLIKTWSPKGVTFLGISDPEDPKNTEAIDVYVKKHDIAFVDVALDAGSRCSPLYRVTGLPGGVIIDRKGKIRWRGHMAFFPKPLIEKALSEK